MHVPRRFRTTSEAGTTTMPGSKVIFLFTHASSLRGLEGVFMRVAHHFATDPLHFRVVGLD